MQYTYRVPQELNEEIAVGKRVVVQFGKRKIYTGIILQIHENKPPDHQAKYILSVMDNVPLFSDEHLRFWKWIADYYMCTLGEVMNAAVPPGLKLESQSRVVLRHDAPTEIVLDALEIPIVTKLKEVGALTIDEVDKITHRKNSFKYIQSLYEKGIITIEEDIQERYTPKAVNFIRLADGLGQEQAMKEAYDDLERAAPVQLSLLMRLQMVDPDRVGVERPEFLKEYGFSSAPLKGLMDKGYVLQERREVDRIIYEGQAEPSDHELTNDQQQCLIDVEHGFKLEKPVLLHGITSSGKTHVYIELIRKALDQGGQVLYLLPEISLTTQLIRRIQAFFGEQVMVNHSRFNENERMEIWEKVRDGSCRVLMAPRSGIFMPFTDLKLIIVDEEHETTYKQMEPSPRYHARDASIVLAKIFHANIVLGSATPSVETYFNSKGIKYHLTEMKQRFSGVNLPEFTVVDMGEERRNKRNKGVFSSILLDRLNHILAEKEQAILFQNRKGYVPITECTECSWSPSCVHCDITLTYYRGEDRLRCHFCGYSTPPVTQCAACGSTSLQMSGYGTERIEAELQLHFPDARIHRLDQETARKKSALEHIVSAFEKREIDVLIGTQMIAKGLDFDNLRLVGIVDADHALNFPDFRAFERSFQLFTQVAGRAGRRKQKGEVIIQTNQPAHRIIQTVTDHDYDTFYAAEIADRKRYNYPPYTRLVRVTLKHRERSIVQRTAGQLAYLLKTQMDDHVLGPQEPYVSRIRNQYIQIILIKIDPSLPLSPTKKFILGCVHQIKGQKAHASVRILCDADPF